MKTARFAERPAGESKPANAPTGSPGEPPECPAANVPFVAGPASQCAPYRELIAAKLVENLSYQRIQQDLAEAGIHGPLRQPEAILSPVDASSGVARATD